MSISEQEAKQHQEDWMNRKWRPAMGWMYMTVCVFDFIVFPILWSGLQAISDGRVETQWDPLTLKGAGLFHMAMGAVLGIAAWSRGQEKIAGSLTPALPATAVPLIPSMSPPMMSAPSMVPPMPPPLPADPSVVPKGRMKIED